jgi:hypothetical protein
MKSIRYQVLVVQRETVYFASVPDLVGCEALEASEAEAIAVVRGLAARQLACCEGKCGPPPPSRLKLGLIELPAPTRHEDQPAQRQPAYDPDARRTPARTRP